MKTFEEQIEDIRKNYLQGCDEEAHKQNLLAAILRCEEMKEIDRQRGLPPEFAALVQCKQMLLVDALRRRMGL